MMIYIIINDIYNHSQMMHTRQIVCCVFNGIRVAVVVYSMSLLELILERLVSYSDSEHKFIVDLRTQLKRLV